jgi:hypothetical protein
MKEILSQSKSDGLELKLIMHLTTLLCTRQSNGELDTVHFMKKDWIARDTEAKIEDAITKLSEAACKEYPDRAFTKWYFK